MFFVRKIINDIYIISKKLETYFELRWRSLKSDQKL